MTPASANLRTFLACGFVALVLFLSSHYSVSPSVSRISPVNLAPSVGRDKIRHLLAEEAPVNANTIQLDLPTSNEIIPTEETAYVAIHFHERDSSVNWVSLNGIRTMFASLRDSNRGNQRPLVVFITPNTDEATRNAFLSDGLSLLELPPQSWRDPCEKYFAKLHLWSLVQYRRLVFIDSDVLIQRPLDELFQCGHYCMVYASILHFTDAILVVRPDRVIYDQLLAAWQNLHLGAHTSGSESIFDYFTGNFCHMESWHFLIHIFGNIEAAPLFEHEKVGSLVHESPIMRLQASISLNAMMYYENFSWRLMRSAQFRNYTDDMGIPAYSLGFTTLKPYHWAPGIFFNLGWHWHEARDRLLGISHWNFLVISSLIIALEFYIIQYGFSRFFYFLYRSGGNGGNSFIDKMRNFISILYGKHFPQMLIKCGVNNVCILYGFFYTIILGIFISLFIPPLIPAHLAWPVFICVHTLLVFGNLKWIAYAYLGQLGGNHSAAGKNGSGWLLGRKNSVEGKKDEEEGEQEIELIERQSLLPKTQENTLVEEGGAGHATSNSHSPSLLGIPAPTLITRSTSQNALNFGECPTAAALPSSASTNGLSRIANSLSSANLSSLPFNPSFRLCLSDLFPLLVWEILVFSLMRLRVYPEFVVKMFAVFPLVLGCLVAAIQLTRRIFFQIAKIENIDCKDKI